MIDFQVLLTTNPWVSERNIGGKVEKWKEFFFFQFEDIFKASFSRLIEAFLGFSSRRYSARQFKGGLGIKATSVWVKNQMSNCSDARKPREWPVFVKILLFHLCLVGENSVRMNFF